MDSKKVQNNISELHQLTELACPELKVMYIEKELYDEQQGESIKWMAKIEAKKIDDLSRNGLS